MPATAAQIAIVNDLKKIRKAAYTNSQLQLYTVRFWSQFTDAQMGRLRTSCGACWSPRRRPAETVR